MIELFGLTVAITVAIIASYVISMAILFAVMTNPKAMKFITEWYIKQMEKICKAFDDVDIQ